MPKITEYLLNKAKSLRIAEAVIMSGFFMISCFFARPLVLLDPLALLKISAGVLFYILAVYSLNSFSGYRYDRTNPRLQNVSGIKRMPFGILTVIFLLINSFLFYSLKPQLLIYSICAFALWCLYYLHPIKLKTSFLGGTIIHLLAQVLHFHLGYAALADTSWNSVAIAFYFSLILGAGHLHHELIDYTADKANNVKTTAVRLGYERALQIMELLFLTSVGYWMLLYFFNLIDNSAFFPFWSLSLFILLFYKYWNTRSIGTLKFRLYYRILFFAAGVIFIGLKTAGA